MQKVIYNSSFATDNSLFPPTIYISNEVQTLIVEPSPIVVPRSNGRLCTRCGGSCYPKDFDLDACCYRKRKCFGFFKN